MAVCRFGPVSAVDSTGRGVTSTGGILPEPVIKPKQPVANLPNNGPVSQSRRDEPASHTMLAVISPVVIELSLTALGRVVLQRRQESQTLTTA
jgi:hypothetical protein